VCSEFHRLVEGGCAQCAARFGERFVALAKRVRSDEQFKELCWRALTPALRVLFVEYFGAAEDCAPNSARTEVEQMSNDEPMMGTAALNTSCDISVRARNRRRVD
jgi:hypothetical protein